MFHPNLWVSFAIFVLALGFLACRPVIAIGWVELLILIVIIIFLFGPYLLRIYRTYETLQKEDKSEEIKKE